MKNKNNKNIVLYILLVLAQILIGIIIGRVYLVDSFNNRILKGMEYSSDYILDESALNEDASGEGIQNTLSSLSSEKTLRGNDSLVNTSSEKNLDTENSSDDEVTIDVYELLQAVEKEKIAISSASESSTIIQEAQSNTAYQAYDGDLDTSWQEGVSGPGEGSWLTYTFDDTYSVSQIVFYLGVWREAEGKDYYHDNCRPRELQISMGNKSWVATFEDIKSPQVVKFSEPVEANEIIFTVVSVYPGNKYEDTGIAEIEIY